MRILIALSEYHRRGGWPRYGAHTALALAGRGHEVTVLTRHAETRDEDERIDFRFYKVPGRGVLAPMAVEPMIVTRAIRRLAGEYDVVLNIGIACLAPVVLLGLSTHRGYVRASAAGLSHRPLRRLTEAVRPFHRVILAWERAVFRGRYPRLVIVGDERYGAEFSDLYEYPADRIVTVPQGVDTREFSFDPALRTAVRAELGLEPDQRLLVQIGNRGHQKGVDVLAEALRLLPPDGRWVFAFAGDGSRGRGLEARTRTLRRRGHVRLLGRVPDVRALYCAADLLVFPSRYDAWGLVVTEALACGTPVLASSTIGAATAVRPGENGALLVDPTDPIELRDGILAFLERPAAYDRARVADSVAWLDFERGAERIESCLRRATSLTSEEVTS